MTDHIHPDGRFPTDDAPDAPLETLLREARAHYNAPPTQPPLDAMWAQIEDGAFGGAEPGVVPLHRRSRWSTAARHYGIWAGLAAGLLIGVVVGRRTVHAPVAAAAVASTERGDEVKESIDPETARYLGQTAALLVSLPAAPRGRAIDDAFVDRAQQLLATTRVLLDGASDGETRALLEDLELVLAQIVGMRAGNRREELELINQALEQRELLPRLHSAAYDRLSSGAD